VPDVGLAKTAASVLRCVLFMGHMIANGASIKPLPTILAIPAQSCRDTKISPSPPGWRWAWTCSHRWLPAPRRPMAACESCPDLAPRTGSAGKAPRHGTDYFHVKIAKSVAPMLVRNRPPLSQLWFTAKRSLTRITPTEVRNRGYPATGWANMPKRPPRPMATPAGGYSCAMPCPDAPGIDEGFVCVRC
jgi:hypothetical protein